VDFLGESAAGDQAMQVGMMHQVLAPGIRARDPESGPEAFLSELEQGGRGGVEEQRRICLGSEANGRRTAGRVKTQ
jgi:hypothetical protein